MTARSLRKSNQLIYKSSCKQIWSNEITSLANDKMPVANFVAQMEIQYDNLSVRLTASALLTLASHHTICKTQHHLQNLISAQTIRLLIPHKAVGESAA